MLAEGVVDRVLVLAPSTTIEKGLTEKFRQLSADADLLRLIPEDAKIRNPRIINATETIGAGDICIENIHSEPERKFVEKLIANSDLIDAWIKSRDTGFYSIDYSWRKGEHPKQAKFNPDFFIKLGNKIIVIEIKEDALISKIKENGDLAKETRAKYKYAIEHFQKLNNLQDEQIYYFSFLTPADFDNFFGVLRKNKITNFKSKLDASSED